MAVEGVEKLMRQFNQLGSMEPVVYKSVKRQAEVVRGVAVKLCPVYSPKGDPIPEYLQENSEAAYTPRYPRMLMQP